MKVINNKDERIKNKENIFQRRGSKKSTKSCAESQLISGNFQGFASGHHFTCFRNQRIKKNFKCNFFPRKINVKGKSFSFSPVTLVSQPNV